VNSIVYGSLSTAHISVTELLTIVRPLASKMIGP
jgi:hypothetical protein